MRLLAALALMTIGGSAMYATIVEARGPAPVYKLSADFKAAPTVWYDANIMGHIVIPDQPGPDAGIMEWSRYLSELDKLPQDGEGVQVAIQGARDMIAELEWLKPEGPENSR